MRELLAEKSGLRIALAAEGDAELIAAIAASVRADQYANDGRGFLIFALDAEGYKERMRKGHLVGLLLQGDRPVGFFCAVKSDILKAASLAGVYGSAYQFALSHAEQSGISSFVFGDQFAILPVCENQGLGSTFIQLLLSLLAAPVYLDAAEKPLWNPRIRFWEKHGFRRVGEVVEELPEKFRPAADVSSVTWGIYLFKGLS